MDNIAEVADSGHRRAERDEVFLRTSLTLGRKSRLSVQLVNISPFGFMLRTNEPAAIGAPLRIKLPEIGEIAAHVVWSLGGRIGAEFNLAISEADYPVLLDAVKNARPNWLKS